MTTTRTKWHREVRRPYRTTIRYTVSGPADGPTLALVHGWACHRGDFDAVTDHLPETYRVLAIDLAEHGESRSARDAWTIAEFAHDVAAVLRAESVTSVVVAGHSLGGAVAVEAGRLLPGTVTQVIALDALHYLGLFPAIGDEQARTLIRGFHDDFAAAVRGLVEGGSPEGTASELKDTYFHKMVAVRQPAGVQSIEGLIRWDMDAALRETTQPITVFAIRDLISQEAIDRYGDRLDLELIDLGSHHFPVESPDATAKLLAGVITGQRVRDRRP
ncbi:alpha/beta fold hydrolase [Myceligenerans pegani]|uniref:Alpha/beta hydrolase n=1 Tax=Myceligenerans pegani TaxID=2776917 RepID=A0ABR9MZ66_9MICO|nr:alpha/beta hydrolase [Myceligenerans sp. TRM 65318]MBE1876689.1 alpha/beta hydrolase [Myceligenerans sp. TRM 65318]MBE3018960.1 alpha/beta hydrolase [Myceligenerans sp. TRM 65318]